MKTLIANDLHLGVQRTGGTTLASAAALREFLHEGHRNLLQLASDNDCGRVIVNGDLSDQYDIPLIQALQIYEDTANFMDQFPDIEVVWALGNHDLSKDSSKLGTVAFIGALLKMRFAKFRLINKPELLCDGAYVLPHVANQDIFDLELTRIPDGVRWLFLHCNYDNKFACAADHSLNLSREQAKELKARGIKMVFGHEHQGRESLGGHVIVVGNQIPSSIADCLAHGDGQKNGTKRAMIINHDNDTHEFIEVWSEGAADGWFKRVDWKDLLAYNEVGRGFIRVEGDASSAEAADVIKTISTFRQKSAAYVVTNGVKIEQIEGLREIASSIEDVRGVDVVSMLLEHLTPDQADVVRSLYANAKKEETV